MASTRLTKDMRKAIVKALMAHRYGAEAKALCDECEALMQDAFKEVMGDAYGRLDDLPEGWFPTVKQDFIEFRSVESFFKTKWNGEGVCYQIKYDPDGIYGRNKAWPVFFNKCVRIPYRLARATQTINSGALYDRAANLAMRTRRHVEEYNGAEKYANGVLNAFTTVEKLITEWPDIEPFIPQKQVDAARAAKNLPAVPVEDMRKKFKLPKGGK